MDVTVISAVEFSFVYDENTLFFLSLTSELILMMMIHASSTLFSSQRYLQYIHYVCLSQKNRRSNFTNEYSFLMSSFLFFSDKQASSRQKSQNFTKKLKNKKQVLKPGRVQEMKRDVFKTDCLKRSKQREVNCFTVEYKRAYYIYFTKKKKHLFVQQWLEKMENEYKQQDETAVLTVQHFPSVSSLPFFLYVYIFCFYKHGQNSGSSLQRKKLKRKIDQLVNI